VSGKVKHDDHDATQHTPIIMNHEVIETKNSKAELFNTGDKRSAQNTMSELIMELTNKTHSYSVNKRHKIIRIADSHIRGFTNVVLLHSSIKISVAYLTKKELLNSLIRNSPQITYHLPDEELESITLHPYTLRAKFCRQTHKCGGECIFVQDNTHCTNINTDRYSNKRNTEICTVKLHIFSCTIVIITDYRSPTGYTPYFLNDLEAAVNQVYNITVDIV
jgi:hypothetical protein